MYVCMYVSSTELIVVSDTQLVHRVHVPHTAAVGSDAVPVHGDLPLELGLLSEVGCLSLLAVTHTLQQLLSGHELKDIRRSSYIHTYIHHIYRPVDEQVGQAVPQLLQALLVVLLLHMYGLQRLLPLLVNLMLQPADKHIHTYIHTTAVEKKSNYSYIHSYIHT